MPMWIAGGLLVVSMTLTTGSTVQAQQPTFADLLARAQAQADAGHRWSPPGDNLADTIIMLFQLAATATPEELTALADLLERDRKSLQQSPGAAPPAAVPPPGAAPRQAPAMADVPPAAGPPLSTDVPPAAPNRAPTVADVSPTGEPPPSAAAAPGQSLPTIANIPRAEELPPAAAPPKKSAPAVANVPRDGELPPAAVAPPVGAPRPAASAPAAPVPASPQRPMIRLPDPHAAELFVRGKAAEEHGDISGARRFYAAAAERGHAAAARNLGRLYDPAVLDRIVVGGNFANPDLARHWYERAAQLGDRDATPLLQALTAR